MTLLSSQEDTEHEGIVSALLDLLDQGVDDRSFTGLSANVRELWGDATPQKINCALRTLIQIGRVERVINDDGGAEYALIKER